jgi:hypothetical protein
MKVSFDDECLCAARLGVTDIAFLRHFVAAMGLNPGFPVVP